MNLKQVRSGLVSASLLISLLVAGVGCTPRQARDSGIAAADPPGRIELSATEFDFGTIPNTDAVSQTFQVRNAGQGELEITGVSTSCGCTTAQVADRRLAPGAATDLTVTYDPQVHEGETGKFMRVVYVRSNDLDTPEASLTVRVTVVEPGEAEQSESTAKGVEIDLASLYKEFVCPCCGDDIGSCSCGMAKERRTFVDQHAASGASQGQIHRAMFQAYGAEAFFDQDLAARVKADLIETLPADRPALTAEPDRADMGTIPIDGGVVSTTFTVRNAGQSDLTIIGMQTSCGCTTAVLETSRGTSPVFGFNQAKNPTDWSAVLAPGEEASLIAAFDPMHHGSDATGEFRRAISIVSNDPLSSRLDVAFDVEVVK